MLQASDVALRKRMVEMRVLLASVRAEMGLIGIYSTVQYSTHVRTKYVTVTAGKPGKSFIVFATYSLGGACWRAIWLAEKTLACSMMMTHKETRDWMARGEVGIRFME
jgi:hypothetical protein